MEGCGIWVSGVNREAEFRWSGNQVKALVVSLEFRLLGIRLGIAKSQIK